MNTIPNEIEIRQDEEERKESVYRIIDSKEENSTVAIRSAQKHIEAGGYEEADIFIAYDGLNRAQRQKKEAEFLRYALYKKPYFAHLELKDLEEGGNEHYYLSDSEDLDSLLQIDEDACLIPFKQDAKRPMFSALFHAYQIKTDEIIDVMECGRHEDAKHCYQLALIRDVEIENRRLKNITPLFPAMATIENSTTLHADELLEQKLKENRNNTRLRNIIATLQAQQFDIIRTELSQNFIVQGCPGSGKTQCLIHRLFFLRDMLKDSWEQVLLITPTQLFRNYSAPLMQRYRLNDIHNTSLSGFYIELLNHYDNRFKSRQYKIELSEEYLPDKYLKMVYSPEYMEKIYLEIETAIRQHILDAVRLLNDPDIHIERYTSKEAAILSERLTEEIRRFDAREKILQDDSEFIEKREERDKLEKSILQSGKRIHLIEENRRELLQNREKFVILQNALEKAKQELDKWDEERKNWEERLELALEEAARERNDATTETEAMHLTMAYTQALTEYGLDTMPSGQRQREFIEYKRLLEKTRKESVEKIRIFCGNSTPAQWEKQTDECLNQYKERIDQLSAAIQNAENTIQELNAWMECRGSLADQNAKRRNEMERTRYYLNRIESAVFEHEVWRATAALKEECDVQQLIVENFPDGHRKETKILYKSDLLFYLHLYTKLYPEHILPFYQLICVDEGQDFHPADYRMICRLYPKAILNIFGDIHQALHVECGIRKWEKDIPLEDIKIYDLNINYRNHAAIVDFCNKRFHCDMKAIGQIDPNLMPIVCNSTKQAYQNVTDECPLIVKNREAFSTFCHAAGCSEDEFEYYDTHTEWIAQGTKACYSVFAAKGLEFSGTVVYGYEMSENQKIVACSRAMNQLFYCDV